MNVIQRIKREINNVKNIILPDSMPFQYKKLQDLSLHTEKNILKISTKQTIDRQLILEQQQQKNVRCIPQYVLRDITEP